MAFAAMASSVVAQPMPMVKPVEYMDKHDNDFKLLGHVSLPDETPAPAVVIVVRFGF